MYRLQFSPLLEPPDTYTNLSLNFGGDNPYRTSVFNKGPLLALSDEDISILTDRTRSSITSYQKAAKCMLLTNQHGCMDDDEWPQFLLHRNAKSQ